jgi:steroid delta-isomerase-like uncharacterized protein
VSAQANKALVRRYADEIWNRANLDALREFVAPDYVLQEPGAVDPIVGPEGLAPYIRAIHSAFPDHRLRIDAIVAEGDQVAWSWTMSGTHHGEYLGIPATGRAVSMTGIALYRLAGGRIVERSGEADTLGLLHQLGALPFDSTRGP